MDKIRQRTHQQQDFYKRSKKKPMSEKRLWQMEQATRASICGTQAIPLTEEEQAKVREGIDRIHKAPCQCGSGKAYEECCREAHYEQHRRADGRLVINYG